MGGDDDDQRQSRVNLVRACYSPTISRVTGHLTRSKRAGSWTSLGMSEAGCLLIDDEEKPDADDEEDEAMLL